MLMNLKFLPTFLVFYLLNDVILSEDVCELSVKSLEGIEKSLNFFGTHHSHIDLDGLYGFLMLENYLKSIPKFAINKKCHEKAHEIFSKIIQLETILSKINRLATKAVIQANLRYYKKMINPMKSFLKLNYKWRFLSTDDRKHLSTFSEKSGDDYNEDQGDSCMKEITDNCTISNFCYLTFIKSPIGQEYYATHQVLYLGLYIKNKCFLVNERGLNIVALQEKIGIICKSLLRNNNKFLQGKIDINGMTTDLFMEIIVICGGQFRYLDFFTREAFNFTKKVQNPNGCFEVNNFSNAFEKRQIKAFPGLDDLLIVKKRRNKFIDGCSSHTLGLGAATFGAFLQKLLLSK